MDKITSQIKLDKGISKKYKVEAICNTTIYIKESESHLLGPYHLISLESYLKEKNT